MKSPLWLLATLIKLQHTIFLKSLGEKGTPNLLQLIWEGRNPCNNILSMPLFGFDLKRYNILLNIKKVHEKNSALKHWL